MKNLIPMTATKLFLAFAVIFVSCKKIRSCNDCENATLFYTPDCATIEGFVIFKDSSVKVFKHSIPEEFRKQGIDVCISYKSKGNQVLTADCSTGEVIKITGFR